MKMKSLFVAIALLFALPGMAQFDWGGTGGQATLSTGEDAKPEWDKTTINFGDIDQGTPKVAEFTLKNTGGKPLIITNVEPSCGCTDVKYPKTPILPGKTAVIKTTYDAKSTGSFDKTLSVYLNIPDFDHTLHIKGTVVEKKD